MVPAKNTVTETLKTSENVYFYASANRQILISENIILWNFIIRTPTFDFEPFISGAPNIWHWAKTVRRTVFPPGGVALSSNLSLTASQVKQKEQAEGCL